MFIRSLKILLIASFIFSSAVILCAQEDEATEYSYGEVVSIFKDQIIVEEYNFTDDQTINVTYTLTDDTTLNGVNSINEIKPGDLIDIDYFIEGAKNIVIELLIERPEDINMDELE